MSNTEIREIFKFTEHLDELIRTTLRNFQNKYIDMGICLHLEGAMKEIKEIFRALHKGKMYSEYEVINNINISLNIWSMKIHKNYRWRE